MRYFRRPKNLDDFHGAKKKKNYKKSQSNFLVGLRGAVILSELQPHHTISLVSRTSHR